MWRTVATRVSDIVTMTSTSDCFGEEKNIQDFLFSGVYSSLGFFYLRQGGYSLPAISLSVCLNVKQDNKKSS